MEFEAESIVKTVITPEIAAKAFAHFDDGQQTAFFRELAKEVKATFANNAYGYGEMQWCYMASALKDDPEANAMYHSLASFAFEFSQDCGMIRERI